MSIILTQGPCPVSYCAGWNMLRDIRVANLTDVCSVTLPTGVPSCGVMLNGQNGNEAALLRVCAAAERALA